jgi:hypothetical protein
MANEVGGLSRSSDRLEKPGHQPSELIGAAGWHGLNDSVSGRRFGS